jgi:hypothetical protein
VTMMVCNEVVYQAIFQGPGYTVSVQYEPGPDGLIFITDVTVTERAVTHFEQHQGERRKSRRGLLLTEQEEHTEAMLPYARLEA